MELLQTIQKYSLYSMTNDNLLDFNIIKKIAASAKIVIQDSEIALYQKNLSVIVNLIAQIKNIDTNNVDPMTFPQK